MSNSGKNVQIIWRQTLKKREKRSEKSGKINRQGEKNKQTMELIRMIRTKWRTTTIVTSMNSNHVSCFQFSAWTQSRLLLHTHFHFIWHYFIHKRKQRRSSLATHPTVLHLKWGPYLNLLKAKLNKTNETLSKFIEKQPTNQKKKPDGKCPWMWSNITVNSEDQVNEN